MEPTIKVKRMLSFTDEPWFSAVLPLIILFVAMSLAKPETFLSTSNIMNVLRQGSIYAIMAVGMTFPIITGGIDLSQMRTQIDENTIVNLFPFLLTKNVKATVR